MKKINLTLLLLLVISVTTYPQGKEPQVKMDLYTFYNDNIEYLNGKVREIHYQSFDVVQEDGKLIKGNPLNWSQAEGVALRQPWSFYFDESGRLVKFAVTDANRKDWIGVVHQAEDNIKNVYWLKEDTLMSSYKYNYPNEEKVVREWKMIQNGEEINRIVYDLDEKGNIIQQKVYNPQGDLTYRFEYIRNPEGKLKAQNQYKEDGTVHWARDNYQYNKNGLFESVHFNVFNSEPADHFSDKVEYEYDDNGNWVERKLPWIIIERRIVYYR